MAYDILIKGARIYDGSGLPSYLGDVAVKDLYPGRYRVFLQQGDELGRVEP